LNIYCCSRAFAKKLRQFLLSLSSSYRAMQCDKDMVRKLSKSRIDQMYYLTEQEKERGVTLDI
jgi:hypothetical protein